MFIPQLTAFWHGLTETARSVFVSIINAMPSSNQTIIIATDDNNQLIDGQLKALFGRPWKELVEHFAIFEKLNILGTIMANIG